jgi:hypothetical protein
MDRLFVILCNKFLLQIFLSFPYLATLTRIKFWPVCHKFHEFGLPSRYKGDFHSSGMLRSVRSVLFTLISGHTVCPVLKEQHVVPKLR